jgi:hypothetical protein
LVFRQVVLVNVLETEDSVRSVFAALEIVEGRQQGHPRLPRVGIHRLKEPNVLIMDVSLAPARKPSDVNPMDRGVLVQTFESFLQVQIPAAEKIDVDLGRRGCTS